MTARHLTIKNSLTVIGATTVQSLNVTGATTLSGATVQSLNVTGATTLSDATVNTLTVTGATSLSDNLTVTGEINIKNAIKDNNDSLGTNGYVLTSTGNGCIWQEVTTQGSQGSLGSSITQGNSWGNILNWNSINSEWQITGDTNLALGNSAGQNTQGVQAIAIGNNAGENSQGTESIAIGYLAAQTSQGMRCVAIGNRAADQNQGDNSIAIGRYAGQNTQGTQSIAIGHLAGRNTQGYSSIAIGRSAGQNTQGRSSIAIGNYAGEQLQERNSIAIGGSAGNNNQGIGCVALGYQVAVSSQGFNSVAIGSSAGKTNQGSTSIAIGYRAGGSTQGSISMAIGYEAGYVNQGNNSIAIGFWAGKTNQGNECIAMGYGAGRITQGTKSIAIGYKAGYDTQVANSIILNASGNTLNATESGFYAAPIRNFTQTTVLGYNTASNEITYYTPAIFVNPTGASAGQVAIADGNDGYNWSQLSFLPLSGGTLTGALNGVSMTLSENLTCSDVNLTGNWSGSGTISFNSTKAQGFTVNTMSAFKTTADEILVDNVSEPISCQAYIQSGSLAAIQGTAHASGYHLLSPNAQRIHDHLTANYEPKFATDQLKDGTFAVGANRGAQSRWKMGEINPYGFCGCGIDLQYNITDQYGNGTNYAFAQVYTGKTVINSAAGQDISIRQGNVQIAKFRGTDGFLEVFAGFVNSSDDRRKHNETSITSGLAIVNLLKPHVYEKTAKLYPIDETRPNSDTDYVVEAGLIAQDVQQIPELAFAVKESVNDEGEISLGLDYQSIFTFAIAAVQDLSAEVTLLKARIAQLEG